MRGRFIWIARKLNDTRSYAFVEFRSGEDAATAIATMDNHAFDSKHTFKLNRFVDIEHFSNLDETYVEPPSEKYADKEHLRAWLGDAQGRDQFVTYRGEDVEVWWHGKPSQCELAIKPVRPSTRKYLSQGTIQLL